MPLSPQQVHVLAWRELRFLQAAGTPELARLAGVIAGIITARDGAGFEPAPLPTQVRRQARPCQSCALAGPADRVAIAFEGVTVV